MSSGYERYINKVVITIINAVVFLDLKKAFDTSDHDVLTGKLSLYGIQESAYDWFKSYLNNRTQKCVVNGSLSKVCSLGCGVPQGTILGPLLFFIYINDLLNCLSFCQHKHVKTYVSTFKRPHDAILSTLL